MGKVFCEKHTLLPVHPQDHIMTARGFVDSQGEVVVLVSPFQTFEYPTLITLSVHTRFNPIDSTAGLIIASSNDQHSKVRAIQSSTDGYEGVNFCMLAGRSKLTLVLSWGLVSEPYVAVDNITVTGLRCDPTEDDDVTSGNANSHRFSGMSDNRVFYFPVFLMSRNLMYVRYCAYFPKSDISGIL